MTFRPLLTGGRLLPILVALVGLALVANVCALPAAVEWDPVEATESRAPGDPHRSDGSHVASRCDAMTAKAAPSCPHATDLLVALRPAVEIVNGGPPRSHQALSTLLAPRRAPDRSLFLLHASFLI